VNAWQSLRNDNIPENHMTRPFSRYGENSKKLIWLANRGKKAHATRRKVYFHQKSLNNLISLFTEATRDT